jgi:hypothetical protein
MTIVPSPDAAESGVDDGGGEGGDDEGSRYGGQCDVTVLSCMKKLTPDWP